MFRRRGVKLPVRQGSRPFRIEPLEARLLLSGDLGDAPALEPAATSLTITFDYTYDTQGFFADPEHRAALENAAQQILSRLTDTLDAIVPGGINTWTLLFPDPSDELTDIQILDPTIEANEILIFAGGQDLPEGVLGRGGPGGIATFSGDEQWITTVSTRGETDPLDVALWGGAITFDNQTNWHFGLTTEGLDTGESDFISVALHELAHTLGVGTSGAWFNQVDAADPFNPLFLGPASVAEYDFGGNAVPLSLDRGHWAEGTTDENRETAMDPSIGPGERKRLTLLDFAGFDDVGWDVIAPVLQAVSFIPDSSGFEIDMAAGFQESVINLYSGQSGVFGAADVTVADSVSASVKGTLVMDGVAGRLRFQKTGGVFAADTYTVTLRSAMDAFKDRDGALLDGDGDGLPGGDYVTTFVAGAPPDPLLTIFDFARGPGQTLDIPATAEALPIRILNGDGVTKVEVTLRFDPDVFEFGTFGVDPELPGGTVAAAQFTSEWIRFTLDLGAPLAAGPHNLINVVASIAATAPYGETSTLYLEDPLINDVAVAGADSAAFVVGYFGDTSGNQMYTALDASRLLRVVVGADTGFDAYPSVDPVLIADITGNGLVTSLDATQILREVVNLDSPNIPPINPEPEFDPLTGTFAPTLLAPSGTTAELTPLSLSTNTPVPAGRTERRVWEWIVVNEN